MKHFVKSLLIGGILFLANIGYSQADSAFLLTPKYAMTANEIYTAPITCKEFEQVLAISAHFQFNYDDLQFVEIIPGSIPNLNVDSNFGLDSVSVGQIRLLWDSGSNYTAADDDVLFSIKFKALANTKIEDDIAIRHDVISSELINENADLFYVNIHFLPAISGLSNTQAAGKIQITPNPMHQQSTITWKGAVTGAEYKLYDNTGKMVRFGAFPDNGTMAIERRNLIPGIYNFNIEYKGKQLASDRLVVE